MPRRFTGKLFQFLFTHLELGTFGERLRWLDRDSGTFQLLWKHGNGSSVTPAEDFALFLAWHELKVRRKPCDGTEAKQRFRAATAKMRLEMVKDWQGVLPEKNFQFRRFPKDDLEYLFKHVDLDKELPEPKRRRIDILPPSPDTSDSSQSPSPPAPVLNSKSNKKPPGPTLMPSDVVVKIEPPDDPPDDPPCDVPYDPVYGVSVDMPNVSPKRQVRNHLPRMHHCPPPSKEYRTMMFKEEREWY